MVGDRGADFYVSVAYRAVGVETCTFEVCLGPVWERVFWIWIHLGGDGGLGAVRETGAWWVVWVGMRVRAVTGMGGRDVS